jgi:hypothetical protein
LEGDVIDRKVTSPLRAKELTLIDELFAVLMTLKLGLYLDDTADRFHVAKTELLQFFSVWVACMHAKLPALSGGPVDTTGVPGGGEGGGPAVLRRTPNVRLVLAWLRVHLESNGTEHILDKKVPYRALLGIDTKGVVHFSSKLWRDNLDPGTILEKSSGFLEHVQEGDVVIASDDMRGVHELLIRKDATAMTFPYDQSDSGDEDARELCRFVSAAVARVRVFRFLDNPIPSCLAVGAHRIVSSCVHLATLANK